MGFEIKNDTLRSEFFIRKEVTKEAFNILKRKILSLVEVNSWITISEVKAASNLIELLTALRWIPKTNSDGNIISITHDGFKVAEEEIVFKTIAPYVQEHFFIQYIREGYSADLKVKFNFDGVDTNVTTWSKQYNEQLNEDVFIAIEE